MDIFQRIFLTNMISLETIRQSQTFSKGRSKRTKMSPSSRKMKIFLLLFKYVNIVSRLEVETRHIFTFFGNIFKNKLKKFLKVNAILIQNFLHTLKINFYVAHFLQDYSTLNIISYVFMPILRWNLLYIEVQVTLIICGLFICDSTYMRLKKWLFSRTYPLIFGNPRSFYLQIHHIRAYF